MIEKTQDLQAATQSRYAGSVQCCADRGETWHRNRSVWHGSPVAAARSLAAEYRFTGKARGRAGSRATYTAPSNVYATADGEWITLVGSSDPIFARLCRAMERPELAIDPRFDTNVHRVDHHLAIDAVVTAWCQRLRLDDLARRLDAEEVPFTAVYLIANVLENPHFRARESFIELDDPELGAIPAPRAVPRFAGHVPAVPCVGPRTGEHNLTLLTNLGLGEADLAVLKTQQVI